MQTTKEISAQNVDEIKKYLSHGDLKEIARITGIDYEIVRTVFYNYQKTDRVIVIKAAMQIIEGRLKGITKLKKKIA